MSCTPPITRVCATLVLGLLLTACSKDPEQAWTEYSASGDQYVSQQEYTRAAIQYKNAINQVPGRAETHYKLGRVYLALEEPISAYQAFARAGDLDPTHVDANLQAGTLLLAAGDFDSARRRAELVLSADAKNTDGMILLGNALGGLNQGRRALEQIEQAIAIDPTHAPACRTPSFRMR